MIIRNLLILPSIAVAIFLIMSGCISTLEYPRELQKTEHYQLRIDTDGPLQDATFYVPLPMKDGAPMIDNRILDKDDFMKTGFVIDFTQVPPERNVTGIHPDEFILDANDPWYLEIHATTWPKGSSDWDVSDVGPNYISSPLGFYKTLYPIGNESILLPKLEFTQPRTPTVQGINSKYGTIIYLPQETKQSIMIYANFTEIKKTPVTIFVFIEGINNWRDFDDTNPSNRYTDEVYGTLNNNKGWNKLSGTFSAAKGEYPDLSSSRWQNLSQTNQQGVVIQ